MTIDQKDNLRLQHIVEAAQHVADFINGVSKEEFEADYEKQSAIVRQIEIIGEAASKLTQEFIEEHKEIDWSKVVGMRHKMIHDYFDVDVNIVWITAINNVPSLGDAVDKIITGS